MERFVLMCGALHKMCKVHTHDEEIVPVHEPVSDLSKVTRT
jgi:hypothetical protein